MAKILDVGSGYNKTKLSQPAFYAGLVGYTGYRGTAALPAFSWEEDPDTGVFSQAANTASISAGGTEIVRVNSSGLNIQSGSVLGDLGGTDKEVVVLMATLPTIFFTTGTYTATRRAAGDYAMVSGAVDETTTIEIPLQYALAATTGSKGFELNSITYVYRIITAAMDAHTYDLLEVTWADAADAAVSTSVGGTLTGTLATTAVAAQDRITTITLGTPYYVNANKLTLFQITANKAATTVYSSIACIFKGRVTA